MTTRALLEEVRKKMGEPPRLRQLFVRLRLMCNPEPWCYDSPYYMRIHRSQGALLRRGRAVWGCLVMANNKLFEPGRFNHPALCVYSTEEGSDDRLEHLERVASRLYKLKGTTPRDIELSELAAAITSETALIQDWTVPASLSGGHQAKLSTIMVFRPHLPDGVLQSGWFPLLTHPKTDVVMIAPSRYWPEEMISLWRHSE